MYPRTIIPTRFLCAVVLAAGLMPLRAAVYQEVNGQVVIEAEHFDARSVRAANNSHWHIVPDDDATDFLQDIGDPFFTDPRAGDAGKYVQVLPDQGYNHTSFANSGDDPHLDFKVHITTVGTYQLYLRWRGHNGGSDSMYGRLLGFGDGPGGSPDYYRYSQGSNLSFNNSWQGVAGPERTDASGGNVAAVWTINDPGVYTIRLTHREDGVALDALAFQLRSKPGLSGVGPAESPVSAAFPPYASSIELTSTSAGVSPVTGFNVALEDGGSSQVDPASIVLSLDGQTLTHTVSKSGTTSTVTAPSVSRLAPGSSHSVEAKFKAAGSSEILSRTFQFTVENYAVLTPDLARAAGTVDTSKPGFSVFVHQASLPTGNLPNSTQRAEDQLRGLLIDPDTGKPYVNHVVGGPNFTDANVINWNQDAPAEIGNFSSANGKEDEPIPGIPGDEASTDSIAAELISFLDLPSGITVLGVNSDDGFRLTSAVNPRDAFATQLGVFDGGRGAADSTFSVFVEQAGIYPVRLIWYEGGGGANLEFFSIDPASGAKILVNDTANPNAIKAYATSSVPAGAIARDVTPSPGASNANAGLGIRIELQDQETTVDAASVKLSLNGSDVAASSSKSGDLTTVTFVPETFFPSGSTQNAVLTFKDSSGATQTRSWTFTVQDYSSFTVIPGGWALPAGGANTGAPGFNVRMHQIDSGRPGGNNLPAPLIQLADGFIDSGTGLPRENLIEVNHVDEAGKWTGTTFREEGVINYNQDARDNPNAGAGTFRPDKPIPGIPGLSGSTDNIAMETTTFLQLDRGVYRMGVNSDDGFIVSTAPHPSDVFDQRLGLFDGGRGAADTLFNFVVEKSGVYPFKLVWWEGGGGANLEWFYDNAETGQRILINDVNDSRTLKAFRTATSLPAYLASVSPINGAIDQPADVGVTIELKDSATKVDTASVQLLVDGAAVQANAAKAGDTTTVTYKPAGGFPLTHTVELEIRFNHDGIARSAKSSFRTKNALAASTKRPVGSLTERGFRGRIHQTAAAGEANNNDRTERQLAGEFGPSEFKVDFIEKGVVNYNNNGGDIGRIGGDLNFPNLVDSSGTDMLTLNSIAMELKTYLELKPGTYRMGVNSDDGFVVSTPFGIARGPSADSSVTVLGEFNGGRGAADTIFEFIVSEEGLYPFRVTWEEGGGGANIEWWHIDPSSDPNDPRRVLINDSTQADAIKAFVPPDVVEAGRFSGINIQGGNIVINWQGAGRLQSAETVAGPWTDVANATSPHTVAVVVGSKFYRLTTQ